MVRGLRCDCGFGATKFFRHYGGLKARAIVAHGNAVGSRNPMRFALKGHYKSARVVWFARSGRIFGLHRTLGVALGYDEMRFQRDKNSNRHSWQAKDAIALRRIHCDGHSCAKR